jgi:phenylalanine-4-hydroxylase
VERIMRTKHIIDDFQQTYFVIDSFEQLLESCYADFTDVYQHVKSQPEIEAHEIGPDDNVLHRGTHAYFDK